MISKYRPKMISGEIFGTSLTLIVEAMHSEFSGRNRSVDFISTSVNEGYYMKIFWNFPEPIVEVNAVVRHFRHPWVLIRKIWQ